jgi:hypothetical protein
MILLKDPVAMSSVVGSEHFEPYSMADRYREIARRTGLNFDAVVQLMEFIPVFIDGERHRKTRRMMARGLAASKNLQEETATRKLKSLFEKLFVPPNEFDLLSQFARPLWREISASIVARSDDTLDLIDEIPSLFYPTLSIRERIKTNEKLASFIDADPLNIDERLAYICLAVLGARPFVGSLVLSVYQIVAQNAGKRSNEIEWPDIFPVSSLNFVDRICKHDTRIGDHEFDTGNRVRCYVQDATYSTEQNRASLFGLGAHTCLGKGIAEFSWRLLVHAFARLDAVLKPLGIEISAHSEPFVMPSTARIGVG